jgi:hypothetical protein
MQNHGGQLNGEFSIRKALAVGWTCWTNDLGFWSLTITMCVLFLMFAFLICPAIVAALLLISPPNARTDSSIMVLAMTAMISAQIICNPIALLVSWGVQRAALRAHDGIPLDLAVFWDPQGWRRFVEVLIVHRSTSSAFIEEVMADENLGFREAELIALQIQVGPSKKHLAFSGIMIGVRLFGVASALAMLVLVMRGIDPPPTPWSQLLVVAVLSTGLFLPMPMIAIARASVYRQLRQSSGLAASREFALAPARYPTPVLLSVKAALAFGLYMATTWWKLWLASMVVIGAEFFLLAVIVLGVLWSASSWLAPRIDGVVFGLFVVTVLLLAGVMAVQLMLIAWRAHLRNGLRVYDGAPPRLSDYWDLSGLPQLWVALVVQLGKQPAYSSIVQIDDRISLRDSQLVAMAIQESPWRDRTLLRLSLGLIHYLSLGLTFRLAASLLQSTDYSLVDAMFGGVLALWALNFPWPVSIGAYVFAYRTLRAQS